MIVSHTIGESVKYSSKRRFFCLCLNCFKMYVLDLFVPKLFKALLKNIASCVVCNFCFSKCFVQKKYNMHITEFHKCFSNQSIVNSTLSIQYNFKSINCQNQAKKCEKKKIRKRCESVNENVYPPRTNFKDISNCLHFSGFFSKLSTP